MMYKFNRIRTGNYSTSEIDTRIQKTGAFE
jgi:hypothetical protein